MRFLKNLREKAQANHRLQNFMVHVSKLSHAFYFGAIVLGMYEMYTLVAGLLCGLTIIAYVLHLDE